MKRFIRLAPVLVVAFYFGSSCSKKDDTVTPATTPKAAAVCQVTKITTTSTISNLTSTTVQTLEYDNENKLSKITSDYSGTNQTSSTAVTNYIYASGVIKTVTVGSTAANWSVQNGQLVKVTQVGSPNVVDITYDGNGKLTKQQNTYSGLQVTYTAVYDGTGNLTSDGYAVVGTNQNFTESRVYGGFDSKNTPYSIIAKSMGLSYYFDGATPGQFLPESLSKNNPGTSLLTHTETGANYSYTWTWTYTYDANGYLIRSSQSAPLQATTVKTFIYDNCN